MPRAGLNEEAVVTAALAVVDRDGAAALTLASVAALVGVATPSLYKHVGGLAELRSLVANRVLREMADVATAAVLGRSGDDAVTVLMRQLRHYAVEHPARYAAMPADPQHDPALANASGALIGVFAATLRHYALEGSAAIHAIRCLRVIVHGFSSIESSAGFGMAESPDDTFSHLIEMYLSYLHNAQEQ
ncbi:TetR family transcriptional regulator [Rhizocola hellebori]|uniref:TetR family transcriptional regulator n=1 Tax=Rhizocola hellebori TaxID=1392758 RepID=A0A8J3VMC2_9ACTN|nr:TetR-like C-terminal domain-containing protein [Rhizocola hellebori]GIH11051.1 TetR family transcriptional regulator [Rhizocola hellebori]